MRRLWVVFAAMFAVALVVMLPLRFALVMAGADEAGLSAREVSGRVGAGALAAANWRGAGLGDLEVRLVPLALLGGALRYEVTGDQLRGAVRLGRGGGVFGMNGRVAVQSIGGLAVQGAELAAVDIGFSDGVCTAAACMMGWKNDVMRDSPISDRSQPLPCRASSRDNDSTRARSSGTGEASTFVISARVSWHSTSVRRSRMTAMTASSLSDGILYATPPAGDGRVAKCNSESAVRSLLATCVAGHQQCRSPDTSTALGSTSHRRQPRRSRCAVDVLLSARNGSMLSVSAQRPGV